MSFACDACNKAVPVGKRSEWIDRCPSCGGPLTFVGLVAVSSAASHRPKRKTSRHAAPERRRPQPAQTRPLPKWAPWAGAIVFFLIVLLGTSLYLASTMPRQPVAGQELAVAESLTAAEPEQRILEPVEPRRTESRQPAADPPRVREEPSVPKQPQELPPPRELAKADEPPPAEQQTQVQEQAPLEQQPKPQEQKPSGSLLDIPTGQQSGGQQAGGGQKPGMPPGAVKPIPPGEQPKGKALPAIFMGVKAEGKRICIIADCSGSMAYNNRMTRLKKELWKTVEAFTPEQEFYIIYFSDTAMPMTTKRNWWRAGGTDMKKVHGWIDRQQPQGGTEPMPAFQVAFRLKPRPDAIFFLTDGLIPLTTPQGVAKLNGTGRNKVPIHTILFGGELAGVEERVVMVPTTVRGRTVMVPRRVPVAKTEKDLGQLEQVSRDSGGTHRFVPDEGNAGR
jgi:hypothetical protein